MDTKKTGSEGWDESINAFFRRYDEDLLQTRIILPIGLREIERVYFGEKTVAFSKIWYSLPFLIRLPFRWASPLFTCLFCKKLRKNEIHRADGVFMVLTTRIDTT